MRWIYLGLAVVLAAIFAIAGTTPPSPRGEDAPLSVFSADRAFEDVRRIAAEPHVTSSLANAKVADYLQSRLSALGFEVETHEFELPERAQGVLRDLFASSETAMPPTNIIGTMGDVGAGDALLLMAHYDSAGGSPGASDDAAGVAATLEIVRALQEGSDPRRGLIVLFTDAEEIGLAGARAFFESHPLREKVGAIINMEARGGGGRTTMFQTSADNGEAMEIYARAVDRPGASSLATFVYSVLPNDTDLTPALEGDYSAYNFAFIGRPGLYHSPDATPANLDLGSLQDMGDQVLALTRALLRAEVLPDQAPDSTFFDMFGRFLLSYSTMAGWLLLGLTAALHIYAAHGEGMRGALRSLGASVGVALLGGGALYVLNLLSGADGPVNYYDRLAAISKLEAQALFACLGVFAATAPWWAGRGSSLIGIVLAAGVQVAAPTASYIVVLPLLLGGLAILAARRLSRPSGPIVAALLAALSLGFLLQNGHLLMQGVGPDYPFVSALLAMLAVPAVAPLVPKVSLKPSLIAAAAMIAIAAAIALWVRLDPIADTAATYSRSV